MHRVFDNDRRQAGVDMLTCLIILDPSHSFISAAPCSDSGGVLGRQIPIHQLKAALLRLCMVCLKAESCR
jgi:hypothetical protein